MKDTFPNDSNRVREFCEKLEIKTITEMLREEYKNYDIKSVVQSKGFLKGIITFNRGPCSLHYPLVWVLTLRKKAS